MAKNLSLQAKGIIKKILYITIATSSKDGQPWNSPVYSAYDQSYNFYWNSWKDNRHSKNIASNPKVFLVIYDSTVVEGTGRGVYIQARASMLTDEKEIEYARSLLEKRKTKPSSKLRSPKEFMGDYPRRVYKAIPEKVWINTDGNINGNYVDKRVEVKLT
ncbi:MAG: pyridoxamine 5'-phosphate oxidase family protein [Candidatus Chisholmbacteria bacterium]|nr:pyridoxamine 5'-phosphate oxidase family protein [Candidatus Chisholmbacteria bacterium]